MCKARDRQDLQRLGPIGAFFSLRDSCGLDKIFPATPASEKCNIPKGLSLVSDELYCKKQVQQEVEVQDRG